MFNEPADADAAVIRLLWDRFQARRSWPMTKEFLLEAIGAGVSLATLQSSRVVSLRGGRGEEARPSFDALVSLPEVKKLLAPVPSALREAANAYVEQALEVRDNFLPGVTFDVLSKHWTDREAAAAAFDLLRSTDSGLFLSCMTSGADPHDIEFHISFEYLRFEGVETLEDVLRIRNDRRSVDPGRFPSGQHLELLQKIQDWSRREQRWPRALSFALATRRVGYIPQLVHELRDRFIRGEFRPNQHQSLALSLEALRFVDPSGDERALFAKAVRGIVDLWRSRPDPVEIPLGDLAKSLGVQEERLGPVVAYLESSPWCTASHASSDGHASLVVRPGDPMLVLRNAAVTTFEEYMTLWDPERREQFPRGAFGFDEGAQERDGGAIRVPSLAFDFIKKDSYRRVLEADVEELAKTIQGEAWKASLILIGGIIEGALLDVLSRREDLCESQMRKEMGRASLMDLILAGVAFGLVPEPVLPFAEGAKDYRDLVHPFRSGASPLRATPESVSAMLHAAGLVVSELDTAARDGRLSRFELT